MDVTDEQWAVLEPLIPEPPRSRHGRGRLWRLREGGAQLCTVGAEDGGSLARSAQPLPPPYQTSRRRFQRWVRDGMLRSALEALAEDPRGTRRARPLRVLHRRHVRGGK